MSFNKLLNKNTNSSDISVEKGNEFEAFIARTISENGFTIIEWSTDVNRKYSDIFVESSTKPDFLVKDKRNYKYYIECKFRSTTFQDKINWCKPEQLKRYQNYSREYPLYIFVGFEGTPQNPRHIYLFNIEDMKYYDVYPSKMRDFEVLKSKEIYHIITYLK